MPRSWNLKNVTNMNALFNNTAMNPIAYTHTLNGWAANPNTPSGRNLGAANLTYSSSDPNNGHKLLTASVANGGKGWNISEQPADYTGALYNTTFLPIQFGILEASLNNGNLEINWQTLSETNNRGFDIEASVNGTEFIKIGSMASKALSGHSATSLNYHFSRTLTDVEKSLLGLPAFLTLFCLGFQRRKRALILGLLILILTGLQSGCKKNGESLANNPMKKIMVRLVQVDRDGSIHYSKIIQAIAE